MPCLGSQTAVGRLGDGQPDYRFDVVSVLQEFGAKGSFIQYGGVADHALVVRGITTVFNTDYITDVIFHLNGAIKVGTFLGPFQPVQI